MQNEIAMLKMQMGIMEKDYKRRIQGLEDRNIDLTLQLEETRKSAESRIESMYRSMKSQPSEPIIQYEYIKTPVTVSTRTLHTPQPQSTRQLENLNLVLETKDQEIRALEERILLLKSQHSQQLTELEQHYESILKSKIKNEMITTNIEHERSVQQYQISQFNLQYSMKSQEERYRKLIDEKDKIIEDLRTRISEFENLNYQDQILQLQETNVRIKDEFNMLKQDFKSELELLNNMHQADLQQAYQQGFESAESNSKAQNELTKINGLYKQTNDKLLKIDAENRQLNVLLTTYQQEIQEWKDKYQTTIVKQKEEIEKLRQSFDRQKKEQLEVSFNAEYMQEKNRLLFQLEQANKQVQQLQQQVDKSEKELKSLLSEQYNSNQLTIEITSLQKSIQLITTEYENYKKKALKNEKQFQDEIQRLTNEIKSFKNSLANSSEDKHRALQDKQNEIDKLNTKLQQYESQLRSSQNEIERLKKENQQQRQQFQSQIEKLNTEINSLQEKVSLLSMERYNFEQQLQKQKGQSDQLANLQRNMLQQNEIIQQLTQELEEERNQSQLLLNREQQYKQQIQQLKRQLQEQIDENEQLTQEKQHIEEQLAQYEADFQNFEIERKKKQQQIEALDKKNKNTLEELEMKEDQLNEMGQNHYNELERLKQEYIKQFEQQKKEAQKLVNAIQDREIQNQQLQDSIMKVESENSRLKNQVISLQKENQEMEQQIRKQQVSFQSVADKLADQEIQRPSYIERHSQINY